MLLVLRVFVWYSHTSIMMKLMYFVLCSICTAYIIITFVPLSKKRKKLMENTTQSPFSIRSPESLLSFTLFYSTPIDSWHTKVERVNVFSANTHQKHFFLCFRIKIFRRFGRVFFFIPNDMEYFALLIFHSILYQIKKTEK